MKVSERKNRKYIRVKEYIKTYLKNEHAIARF